MLNAKVLVSGADFLIDEAPINPYYGVKIDTAQAQAEHSRIRQAFTEAGIEVIQVPPPSGCQDGIYVANWGLCRGDTCVLSRLPGPRRAEEAYAAQVLAQLGKSCVQPPKGLKYSGQGDSLPCGRYLLAGSGYRSDAAAQAFAARELGLELVQLHTLPILDAQGQPLINAASGWPDSFFYDLDIAIAVLRDDLIAYCPEAFDAGSLAKLDVLPVQKILVDRDEAVRGLACNLVSTGETVVMSAHAPQLQCAIKQQGFRIITLDLPEIAKAGGYIRCSSLTLS
jgi:N-dimethylarginine dimethylaminohydrolase